MESHNTVQKGKIKDYTEDGEMKKGRGGKSIFTLGLGPEWGKSPVITVQRATINPPDNRLMKEGRINDKGWWKREETEPSP